MKKSSSVLTLLPTFFRILYSATTSGSRNAEIGRGDAPRRLSSRRQFSIVFSLILLGGVSSAFAGWNPAPPGTVTPGTTITLAGTAYAQGKQIWTGNGYYYQPTYLHLVVRCPDGSYNNSIANAGVNASLSFSQTRTLSQTGTYTFWVVDCESSSPSTSMPTGTIRLGPTSTVSQLTATTFAFTNLSHTYDGNTKTASVTPNPGGATYSSDLTKGPNAGSYTVTATANGNYTGSGSATLTINKANQSAVSITSGSSYTFGNSYTASASGGNGGGSIVWALGSGSTAPGAAINSSTGAVTANSVGTVVIRAYRAGDANYNQSATTANFTITVNPIATTFSISPTSFTYNGGAQGPSVAANPSNATFTTGGTLSATNAGTYTATATANGNYSGSNSSLSWSISKANQTITFNNPGPKTYGTPLTLSASASSNLAVSYSVTSGLATVSGNTVNFTGTGSVTIKASQAGNGNYNAAADVSQTFTVGTAPTTFALNQTSFTYSGNAQGPAVVPNPGNATFTTGGTLSAVNVGSYTATATANGNYSGSNSALTWTIAASGQTITFNNPGPQTYGTTFTLSASATSNLPVSFTSTSGATVAGNVATFTGTGSVTITASQGGNSNYGAAAPVSQSFTVNKATPAKSFANRTLYTGTGSNVYFVTAGDRNASFTNAGNGVAAQPSGTVAYTIATGSPSGTPGTTVANGTPLPLGTYLIQASYPGDANYNAAAITATWMVKIPPSLASQLGLGSQSNIEQNDANNAQTGLKVNRPQ